VSWSVYYSNDAQRDAKKLARSELRPRVETLLAILAENPFQNPPPYKSLQGELSGAYSRRINIQHRLVYKVDKKDRSVLVIRMWAHT
jgi:Txe/YoeB family toxin of toxin-antitoxin system